jgi:hypothetical protein
VETVGTLVADKNRLVPSDVMLSAPSIELPFLNCMVPDPPTGRDKGTVGKTDVCPDIKPLMSIKTEIIV